MTYEQIYICVAEGKGQEVIDYLHGLPVNSEEEQLCYLSRLLFACKVYANYHDGEEFTTTDQKGRGFRRLSDMSPYPRDKLYKRAAVIINARPELRGEEAL